MTNALQDDADDLLNWLNAHSVSISDGIPFSLIQQKWIASKRTYDQLRTSLEWLFAQGLLAMTPALEQPHVRLTSKGFEQLLRTIDTARQPPPAVVVAVAAQPDTPAAGSFKPAPLPPPVLAPAPVQAAIAPVEAAPANRFVDPAKPPTEIGLRNQILAIYRDLKLVSGQQLIAMTLTRYWQEMGQRGEHLRAGIDVMLRDGYLKPAFLRYENYWMLTDEGAAYVKAPISPPALLALARPLKQIEESRPDDEQLRRKALALFKNSATLPFVTLESTWRLSHDSLIHALDLLIKSGDVQLTEGGGLLFALTSSGARRR